MARPGIDYKFPEGKGKLSWPAPTNFRGPQKQRRGPKWEGRASSIYTADIAVAICQRIMEGKTLKAISEEKGMPSNRTILRWLNDPRYVDFREHYYNARRTYAEILMDEIIEIADDTSNDWIKTYNKKGEENGFKPNHEHVARCRLKIDTRKYLALKLIPRIYGDKLEVEHGVTSELKDLLKESSNKDKGLPPPIIEGEIIDE